MIERLRALEKDIRESVALADAEALGVMGINRPARWADELATLIAELGQEVGAVAMGEVVEGEAAGRAISFPNGYSVTLDALAIGTKIYAGSPPTGGEHMALHWIERYAAGIDDEPQIDLIRDALTHPAHTSEARDCPAQFFASGPQGDFFTADSKFANHLILVAGYDRDDWTVTDLYAAMRQEGGK